jgi:uncharacterized protein (DUF2267 family)
MADFVETVRRAGGFATLASAAQAIDATLAALGARLLPVERDLIAAALPPAHAAGLTSAGPKGQLTVEDLVRAVADREGVAPPTAKEHVQVVLAIVAERLDAEARALLERRLPPSVLALLGPLPVAAAQAAPEHEAQPGRALSSGRPGGDHPLSEARPHREHAQSVAAENPHGESKLASASGIAQERSGETLASGTPGSRRPISDRDE